MIIKVQNTLSAEQKETVRWLNDLCNTQEGLDGRASLTTELNFDKSIPSFYLGYDGEELTAFLSLFMPEKEQAEVTAYTHPGKRRQGYFSSLCREAVENCRGKGITRFLFQVDEKSGTGKQTLAQMEDVRYQFSEYGMRLERLPEQEERPDVYYEEITERHKQLYMELAHRALNLNGGSEEFLNAVLYNPLRYGYMQFWKGNAAGVFHFNCEDEKTCIYGLGILPENRGMGLGDALVRRAACQAAQAGQPVVLEVDSENERAFHLYEKNGFRVETQINYYSWEFAGSQR